MLLALWNAFINAITTVKDILFRLLPLWKAFIKVFTFVSYNVKIYACYKMRINQAHDIPEKVYSYGFKNFYRKNMILMQNLIGLNFCAKYFVISSVQESIFRPFFIFNLCLW